MCSESSASPTGRRPRSTRPATGPRTNSRYRPGPRRAYGGGMPTGILTGASRGLGLALARALSERGWRLVVDARGAADLKRAWARSANVVPVAGDIADPQHRHALVEAAGDRGDLPVNNASVLGPSPLPPLAEYPLD